MSLSLNAIYNLKAVLNETGINPDVLRAWERRYGLPMPQRTAGGHRLYSEHDIEIIKWLIARQAEGLSISHAVDMWKDKIVQGYDPLSVIPHPATQATPSVVQAQSHTSIDKLRALWLSACLNFNEIAADQALNQAFALYPVEFVCIEMLQRGLVEVGSLWYENQASVQQEHFASALALRRLDALLAGSPAPTRRETILVGCPANEWHTFTPLLLALFMRRRGFNVIYLGANVPAAYFAETADAVNARLVLLAAQQLNTAVGLQQSAALIAGHGGQVAFGGRIFALHPELVARIGGHYLGNRLDKASDVIEGLLASQPVLSSVIPASAEYADALNHFVSQRVSVEAILNQRLDQKAAGTNYYPDANKFMGDNIISALQLGSMTSLDSEIDWLKVLLQRYQLSESLLYDYLETYSGVVSQYFSGQAQPLVQWFECQVRSFQR
jgi:methanogenic corrinoid protein MtbC1